MSDTEDTEVKTINSDNSNPKKSLAYSKPIQETIIMKKIEIISDLFTNICEESRSGINSIIIKPFLTKGIPQISIKSYLKKLSQYIGEESTITMILIYIDRICQYNNIYLSYYNIYKLILASLITAIKFNEDFFYSAEFYARLGGVSLHELNFLENEFLKLIKFKLFVEEELFQKYNNDLLSFLSDEEEEESDDNYNIDNSNDNIESDKDINNDRQ